MSAVRIRIVFPAFESPATRFVGLSASIHLLGLVGMLILPGLFAPDRPPMLTTIDAVLIAPVAGHPKSEAPRAAPAKSPVPAPTPPKGASAIPVEPPKPTQKPPEKPKVEQLAPTEPPPVNRPAVQEPEDSGEAAADGPVDAGGSSGPIGNPEVGAALEGMGVEFDWYRSAVISALFSAWRRPFATGVKEPLEATIAFEILRDGTVRAVQIVSSSGDSRLDRSAVRAVHDASLPPLPRNYKVAAQAAQFVFRLHPEDDF